MLNVEQLAVALKAKAESARILRVPQGVHTPEAQDILKKNGFFRVKLERGDIVYRRRVRRASSVNPKLRANTKILIKALKRLMPGVTQKAIGLMIGYNHSQTSHIANGGQALTDITKLRVLSRASGMSLEEMCDILEA